MYYCAYFLAWYLKSLLSNVLFYKTQCDHMVVFIVVHSYSQINLNAFQFANGH